MRNQEEMQVTYNVKDPIEIMFGQTETGQDDRQLADMGVVKIHATQENNHAYLMWKIIAANERTWVRFKAHFQEAYLNREDIEQKTGATGYGSFNNVKHGEMEDAFMNFALAMAARDVAFTKLTTKNGNLSTQLIHQDDQITTMQAELCNLKVVA